VILWAASVVAGSVQTGSLLVLDRQCYTVSEFLWLQWSAPFAAVILAAAIAIIGSIQQDDLADAIYGDGVSSGVAVLSPLCKPG